MISKGGHPRRAGLALGLLAWLALAGACSSGGSGGSSGVSAPSSFDFGSNNPFRATAFGDSITFGFLEQQKRFTSNLVTGNNYPSILQSLLRGLNPAWQVVNRGVGGELTASGVGRISSILTVDKPGFILIMEGTNDASEDVDPSTIVAHLEAMVLAAKGNKTIPVIGTIPPNFRNDANAQNIIDSANVLIRTMGQAQGIVVAEIFDGMNNRSLFGLSPDRDPLHPNEQGYQVMASIWFTAMQQAIPASLGGSSSSAASSAASAATSSSASSVEVGQAPAPKPAAPPATSDPSTAAARQRSRRR
jgi:lysophospholipase L1-like esterase